MYKYRKIIHILKIYSVYHYFGLLCITQDSARPNFTNNSDKQTVCFFYVVSDDHKFSTSIIWSQQRTNPPPVQSPRNPFAYFLSQSDYLFPAVVEQFPDIRVGFCPIALASC